VKLEVCIPLPWDQAEATATAIQLHVSEAQPSLYWHGGRIDARMVGAESIVSAYRGPGLDAMSVILEFGLGALARQVAHSVRHQLHCRWGIL
jgi:hypothetical protein